MALPFHNAVTLKGFHFEDFHLTMNLSGLSTVTDSRQVVGKAVALDPSAPNTARLAGDDDVVIGRVASFENRAVEGIVVGTIEFKFAATLPVATAAQATIAVGDTVIGAGAGEVKTDPVPNPNLNFVAELNADKSVAVVVKL